jgi:hypothetical protein
MAHKSADAIALPLPPSAPTARGRAARSASRGSGVGLWPLATPSQCAWRCSMAQFPATCPQHHTARTAAPQAQLHSVAAVVNGTKTAKAQPRYGRAPRWCCWGYPPGVSQRSDRWGSAALGPPSHPPAPAERSTEAGALALHAAFTAPAHSTRGAAGPKRWAQGACSPDRFDEVDRQDTRQGPHGQAQLGEGVRLVNRVERAWHTGIIMA